MIELSNVNKFFNRHKKNQIHVINNVNLSFPTHGLVALLGPSGSGKTTLLNTIGGLDKINSGKIYVDGKKIAKRSSRKVDEIRNLNIGYIFQDYKLVEGMTVYENVALSLKINGIKNKDEIKKRVMYTLEKVKMDRFKNRPVNMLSGGERQRVGIARALVKNPKIIIADEPTGNLDSKNSLEIMNIIKSISNNYLVILVTHEEELAKFYADRIIELQDGLIVNDYENKYAGSLNYEIENRIYLKDYKEIETFKKDNINISLYRDNHENIDLKIVYKNGNIYIDTNTLEKIEVIENNSNIELIDEHFQEIKEINITKDTFDIEKISNKQKLRYSSIFKLGSFITYGFKKILDYPILKKILLGGFFISGMFIFYAVSSITATLIIKDEDFISINKDYLTANITGIKVDEYKEMENDNNILYILPSDSIIKFRFPYDKYLQTHYANGILSGSLSLIDTINKDDLIMGRMPLNNSEIVVTEMGINKFMKENESYQTGFSNKDDFLNHEVSLNNMTFKIVGITNTLEPNIYASEDLFINMLANSIKDNYYEMEENSLVDYHLVIDKDIKLKKGRLPENDYEVIVNINNEYLMPINKTIDKKINGKKLKVVGYYENTTNIVNNYYVNNNTIKYNLIDNTKTLSIYSKNSSNTLNNYRKQKINIYESYDYSKKMYLKQTHDETINTLIVSGIILGISLIEILLMIRSSFLSRIKEVGIFRAIGVKKSDIYKMFTGEIIAITVISSLTGIIFMAYILNALTKIPYIENMFTVNIVTLGISALLVFGFNLVVGLLPVFNTIRKTPAQILSRIDVD